MATQIMLRHFQRAGEFGIFCVCVCFVYPSYSYNFNCHSVERTEDQWDDVLSKR